MVAPTQLIEIFFSYSHKDQKWCDKLVSHLSALKRQGLINAWYDREIDAGKERDEEIKKHLDLARVILLLVSADFIASDYCYSFEVTRAMERHNAGKTCVIPVLLHPCDWKGMPFSDLQALPKNGKAITSTSWSNQDEAFAEVAEEIRKVVKGFFEHDRLEETSHSPIPEFKIPSKVITRHLLKFFLTSVGVTTLVVFMRLFGVLQASELWFFDQMMQFQPNEPQDDRLLVVEITKKDIDDQKDEDRQGSLTNQKLFQILNKLVQDPQNQPRVIGLDLYRDFKTKNHKELSNLLATNPLIFGVCKVGQPLANNLQANYGVKPPPEIPGERLGFSDFISDSEGLVRRQLLSMEVEQGSHCHSQGKPVTNAFSVVLAQHFLQKQFEEIHNGSINLQLGSTIFELLDSRHRGGYSFWADLDGYQVLLNYRKSCSEKEKARCSPEFIAKRVTVEQVLQPDFNTKSLKNKIVLIGLNDTSYQDAWYIPFSLRGEAIPGVIMQAQMVSQILSAFENQRPLLHVWSIWYEILWILFWSLFGGAIAQLRLSTIPRLRLSTGGLILSGGVVFISLYCFCLILFITSVKRWVPFVPSALTFLGTGGMVLYIKSRSEKPKFP